ncbi:Putative ABC transport system permease protein [hydrothermal vent metagenome]|uniref:Putative ABC transport system permease protein n=1 Tax=hydrothermal vent metagenome TaxID=652676 RepID=A0A1W1CN40_9ZZZZ
MNKMFLVIKDYQNCLKLVSTEVWNIETVQQIEQKLQQVSCRKKIVWDVSQVLEFDSAGVLLFIEYYERFKKEIEVEVVGYNKKQKEMYHLLAQNMDKMIIPAKVSLVEKLGKQTYEIFQDIMDFIYFLGELFVTFLHLFRHPKSFRIKEVVYHIQQSGLNALVIIGLTAFLVGMVISYQGSVQLAKFGADMFIVDTVSISITRELGPMITAIVIAGRSGSAYTAEIGAMKITEEIAAMRTMGFDPYSFLVLPRVFALMLALPLLIFFSDIVGIFGGMVASHMQLGISFTQFLDRLYEVLEVKHYILGMIKGPVFAFIIVAVGCFRGFQVSDNTESIGLHTTASVVNAIFLVIAFDALFSVIYTELGL